MSIYSTTTIVFKGKDGNLYLFDSTTGYCYLHEYKWGEEGPLLCKTEDVARSIWALDACIGVSCVAPYGGDHRHASISYDDLRCVHIFHGVQLRCLVGNPRLYLEYGRSLCEIYFPHKYDEMVGKVVRMLEQSQGRFIDYALRGILYPIAARTKQYFATGRRNVADLQVSLMVISLAFQPCFACFQIYSSWKKFFTVIRAYFYRLFLWTVMTRRWPITATYVTGYSLGKWLWISMVSPATSINLTYFLVSISQFPSAEAGSNHL